MNKKNNVIDIKQSKISNKQREKNRKYRRTQMNKKRKEFNKLRNSSKMLNENPKSPQETLETLKVAPDGIWQVGEKLFSKCFLLNDLNYCMKTYEEQVAFFGEWCRILNSLDVFLFKITIFNKIRNMIEFRNCILYQHKPDEYNMQRDCYNDIINSKIVDGKKGIEQVKFITITIQRNNYEDARQGLNNIEANLIKEFGAFGAGLQALNSNQRFQVLYEFNKMGVEKEFNGNIEKYINSASDWRNDIANDYIDFSSDNSCFFTERKCCKAMYINPDSYPDDELSDELLDNLVNVTIPSIFSVDYVPINKAATKNCLETKYMAVEDKIRKQQQTRNKNKDFSSEISYPVQIEERDTKEMLEDINSNGQQMFWVGVNMILIADDLDELDSEVDSISLIVENYGCYLDDYFYRQREALYTVLPIGCRYVDEMRTMFTRMAAILIPFKSMEMQMKDHPFYYGVNKETRNIILCNRKKLVNGNGFVFGITGAGKSFTGSKMEMGSIFLNTNDDIIILDPTYEYKDICDAFAGTYIDIGPDTKNHINPLHIDIEKLSSKNIKAIITQKSTIMCGICEHAMEKNFNNGYRSIIDRCVKELYEGILTTPVNQRTIPIMSDFNRVLENQTDPEVHDIILALEVFVSGSMNVFNHQNNVNVENRITAYGLRDIGEDLESVGMLIILSYIRQKIIKNAARGVATWLYVDEFHLLMDKKYSRMYFISLWKKVRKLGGLCTGITQNVSDVTFDKETDKLIANSEYTMFLRMGVGEDKFIVDKFEGRITNAHLKYIQNAEPGTGLIRFGNVVIPMDNRIEKGNIFYDIFNTNFYEKAAIKQARSKIE